MPLYEYKCRRCGKTFEALQKFSDEPLKTHPECGGEVARLLSPPALQFKGTGWYVTDYGRHGTSSPHDGRNGKSGSTAETKKETKSESKSESKSATASPSPSKP